MKINKFIAQNVIRDFQKHSIDKIDRARFIKYYMEEHEISLRQLSQETGIPKTTLHDQLMYNRLNKHQMVHLGKSGLTKTQIHKYLQNNMDKKYLDIDPMGIDIELQEVISKLKKYDNGNMETTTQTKILLKELSNLVHRIMVKLK